MHYVKALQALEIYTKIALKKKSSLLAGILYIKMKNVSFPDINPYLSMATGQMSTCKADWAINPY